MSKNIFSFCLYGGAKKYCEGLLENIKIIEKEFPDFEVWIYLGTNVPQEYIDKYKEYSNVNCIATEQSSTSLMCNRFFPIDNDECKLMICRDADSRIHSRDMWCINDFINSDKLCHSIRDHYWHKSKITGGLWGLKKGAINVKLEELYNNWILSRLNIKDSYNTDCLFLNEMIYPVVQNTILIHTNINAYEGEIISHIEGSHNDIDFVGNVIEYDSEGNPYHKFTYNDFPFIEQIKWLYNQKQWSIISNITKDYDIFLVPEYTTYGRTYLLTCMFDSSMNLGDIERAKEILSLFVNTRIDNSIIKHSNMILEYYQKNNIKTIIGTTDLYYEPQENEIVIYYGSFHHDIKCLPISNKIYRHPVYFFDITHNINQYHSSWSPIEYIYILNLEERYDRYLEILCELCKIGAPLHYIYHYKAKKEQVTGDKKVDSYLGATKNHLDVTKHFIENKRDQGSNGYCLVLEDDVVFTSNIQQHMEDLKKFFERSYDFDICFTSCSKCHEYRLHDDLLMVSYQDCTTTSGYILDRKTAHRVLECYKDGYDKMKTTMDYHKYVCDRYWDGIRGDGKMFIFRNKFGYQRPCWSSISNTYNFSFD